MVGQRHVGVKWSRVGPGWVNGNRVPVGRSRGACRVVGDRWSCGGRTPGGPVRRRKRFEVDSREKPAKNWPAKRVSACRLAVDSPERRVRRVNMRVGSTLAWVSGAEIPGL